MTGGFAAEIYFVEPATRREKESVELTFEK
jgi:hypothetical protein